MPGFLLHVNTGMTCTHAAPAMVQPVPTRVLVNQQPVATVANLITVTGCPFQIPVGPGTKPQPCVTVKWANISGRVKVMGQFVLLQTGPCAGGGTCLPIEQTPQGPPIVNSMLMRVKAM
jgi:hypothetical protein